MKRPMYEVLKGRLVTEADVMAHVLPDFTCTGCGHGAFGAQPVHCVKCGGLRFSPKPEKLVGNASVALDLMQVSEAVRALLRKLQSGKVSDRCRRMVERAQKNLRMAIATVYEAEKSGEVRP